MLSGRSLVTHGATGVAGQQVDLARSPLAVNRMAALRTLAQLDHPPGASQILVLNKVDTLTPAQRQYLAADNPDASLISARTGDGVDALLGRIGEHLPVSPYLYPDDELSTLALAEPNVQRAIDGREVRRVVVKAPKLVNVVV